MNKSLGSNLYNSGLYEMALRELRWPLIMVVISFAVSMLGLTLIPGKNAIGELAYLSFFDAFYFTAYTASTIGYGEIPYPFTDFQRLWAIFSIIITVTTWFYALTKVIQIFTDKAVRDYFYLKSVAKDLKKIKDDFIIIVGYSRITKLFIERVQAGRKELRIVIIESDQVKILQARADLANYEFAILLEGSFEEKRVLRFAGVEKPNCIAIMAWMETEEKNLGVAILSSKMNPTIKTIIGNKVRGLEKVYDLAGVSDLINPYTIISENIYFRLKSPYAAVVAKWVRGGLLRTKVKPAKPANVLVIGYGNLGKAVEELIVDSVESLTCVDNLNIGQNKKTKYILGDITTPIFLDQVKSADFTHIVITTDSDYRNYIISQMLFQDHAEAAVIVKVKDTENRFIWDSQKHEVWDVEKILAYESYDAVLHQEVKSVIRILKEAGDVEAKRLYTRLTKHFRFPKLYEFTIDSIEASEITKMLRRGEIFMMVDLFRSRSKREEFGKVMPLLYKSWKEEVLFMEDEQYVGIELTEGAKILVIYEEIEEIDDLIYAMENKSELNYLMGK